jgi:hypothetical protein
MLCSISREQGLVPNSEDVEDTPLSFVEAISKPSKVKVEFGSPIDRALDSNWAKLLIRGDCPSSLP